MSKTSSDWSSITDKLLKGFRTFLKVTAAAVLYFLIFQIFYNWMRWYTPWAYEDVEILVRSMLFNLLPILANFYLIYIIVFSNTKFKRAWVKITVDVILTTTILVSINFLFMYFTGRGVDWGGAFFNGIMILLGVETYYYVINYNATMREKAEAREEALLYRYDALKAQIDPHFLFNSLNILSSLIDVDSKKSKEFLVALSRIYRYIMACQNEDRVTVEEEFSFLKYYIDILEMRYAGRLTVKVEVESPRALQRQIIPYTLQLLMENVCKHNVISPRHPMTVDIIVGEDEITFANPIVPKQAETVSRVGIRYLTNLYSLNKREFRIERENGRFTVFVPYID